MFMRGGADRITRLVKPRTVVMWTCVLALLAATSATFGHFVEFGQLLAGVIQTSGTVFGSTDTMRHGMLQPGAGLDYPLNRKWAIRGEVDARFISTGQQIRVAAGIVRRFR